MLGFRVKLHVKMHVSDSTRGLAIAEEWSQSVLRHALVQSAEREREEGRGVASSLVQMFSRSLRADV